MCVCISYVYARNCFCSPFQFSFGMQICVRGLLLLLNLLATITVSLTALVYVLKCVRERMRMWFAMVWESSLLLLLYFDNCKFRFVFLSALCFSFVISLYFSRCRSGNDGKEESARFAWIGLQRIASKPIYWLGIYVHMYTQTNIHMYARTYVRKYFVFIPFYKSVWGILAQI